MTQQLDAAPLVPIVASRWGLSEEELTIIRSVIAPGAPDGMVGLYLAVCRNLGCGPVSKMVYCINRPSRPRSGELANRPDGKVDRWTFQTSIDLFRSVAESSGNYTGQIGPLWCGKDGVWTDVWLADGQPAAAKVGVLKSTFSEPLWAVARWKSYVQTDYEGNPSGQWLKMGDVMISKCAEALALRKAFPQKLSGVYTSDEMAQADVPERAIIERSPDNGVVAEAKFTELRPALVAVPSPVSKASKPTKAPSADEVTQQFKESGIVGDFKDWLVANVAPDLVARKPKRLTPDEWIQARDLITEAVDANSVDEDASRESDPDPIAPAMPEDERDETAAPDPVPPTQSSAVARSMVDSVAAEIGIPPSDAAKIEARVLAGKPLTTANALTVTNALRDIAEGRA